MHGCSIGLPFDSSARRRPMEVLCASCWANVSRFSVRFSSLIARLHCLHPRPLAFFTTLASWQASGSLKNWPLLVRSLHDPCLCISETPQQFEKSTIACTNRATTTGTAEDILLSHLLPSVITRKKWTWDSTLATDWILGHSCWSKNARSVLWWPFYWVAKTSVAHQGFQHFQLELNCFTSMAFSSFFLI